MLIIKTMVHETIWGGEKLTPHSGTDNKKIGHLYSLISNGELESEILNGKYAGQKFKKYFDENKDRFGLSKYKEFPFLLALVDATDDLSLQVHPNDEMAKKLENAPFGKNESWYFLDAPKSGKIFDGCKAKSSQELREKVAQNKYDDVIDYLEVKSGDYVYIEAGTMHAMAAGSLVYEIEENCNATYRVYDFDRIDKDGKKRSLQTENALNSIDVSLKSKAVPYVGEKVERLYSTQLFKDVEEYTNNSKTLECLTLINGSGTVEGEKIQRGVTIVLEPNETVKLNKSEFVIARPLLTTNLDDLEIVIRKWFKKYPELFYIKRVNEILEFNINPVSNIKHKYKIKNIVLNLNNEEISFLYEIDNNKYKFIGNSNNKHLLVKTLSSFLSEFVKIYLTSSELKILSEHQSSIEGAFGDKFMFRKDDN